MPAFEAVSLNPSQWDSVHFIFEWHVLLPGSQGRFYHPVRIAYLFSITSSSNLLSFSLSFLLPTENFRSEAQFENHLILKKTLVGTIFNLFSILFKRTPLVLACSESPLSWSGTGCLTDSLDIGQIGMTSCISGMHDFYILALGLRFLRN